MQEPIISIKNICKQFSGVPVLNGISLDIYEGEITAVIGENGAGKSTLMKILTGIYKESSGDIFFRGEKISLRSPADAKKYKISIIPQEFNLINTLSVYDNIFLGQEEHRKGLLLKEEMISKSRRVLQELGVSIDPMALVETLSVADKQMVEICKVTIHDCRVLIMDEPTTVLTHKEVEILFNMMERLRQKGAAILYISHRLKEVKQICSRVVVLRNGHLAADEAAEKLSPQDMAQLMIGKEFNAMFPEKLPQASPDIVLEAKNISAPKVLKNVSFKLYKGEILGIAGLNGAGRTELAEALMGVRKATGSISMPGFAGGRMFRSPAEALKYGLNYLPEDRQSTGILTGFSSVSNISLASLNKYCRHSFISKSKERQSAEGYFKAFNIKAPSPDSELIRLSGGNQQKVLFAKTLDPNPRILIIDEPTRGVDVQAKLEIYTIIKRIVQEQGLSCIVISSEMEEIIGLCTRVYVMREGAISGEITEEKSVNERQIMFLATGITES